MKIALVIPPYDLIIKGHGSKRMIRAGFFPPLGVGYLAAPLISAGHHVKIIDSPPLNYQNSDIGDIIAEFKPDIIGISSLSASAEEAYNLIKYLKNNFKEIPIVFGGVHVNCFAEEIIKEVPMVDCLVYGEGEITFQEIIKSIEQCGKIKDGISGTWFKDELGNFKKNPPREPIINLDSILPPAFELYDYKIYQPLPLQYKKIPAANIITSRGCPWGECTFCFQSGRAKQRYRRYSPERTVEEIKSLVSNFSVKEITFWDDNFLINEKWIFKFCDLLDKENIKIPWSACARVNTVTLPMLKRAKKSGLWCIFYGFETGNEDLLIRIKKGATLEQARQAAKWTNDLGIDIRGSFMLALPGETPEKALKTINFAKELDVPFVQFLLTFPEWGTELYDDSINSGCIVPHYQGKAEVTYVPDGYKNEDEVRQMHKKAYRSYYFRLSFMWKHLKRIKNLDMIKQYYQGLKYITGISS